MLKHLFYALVCVPLGLLTGKTLGAQAALAQSAHDFTFTAITGEALPLAQFKGQPILIVNTASECGFTSQYAQLQSLHEAFGPRGLVVLAVPSNDFGGQEPGSNDEIKEFCQTQFGVGFVLAAKEHVKGEEAHPFYRWAREERGALAAPKWNFHKYLVGPDGELVDWFASTTSPESDKIRAAVEQLLDTATPSTPR